MYVGRLVRWAPSKSGRGAGSAKPATGASGESALEKFDVRMKAALEKLNGSTRALDQRLTMLELRNGLHPRTEDASILKSCLAKMDALGEMDGRARAGALRKLDALESGTLH
jgi:hypothetical protein